MMYNLAKDGMFVLERLLYTGLYVVTERYSMMGKKKGNKLEKARWQRRIKGELRADSSTKCREGNEVLLWYLVRREEA